MQLENPESDSAQKNYKWTQVFLLKYQLITQYIDTDKV